MIVPGVIAMVEITPRQLLAERRASGSLRRDRKDGSHLALILEGGGMAGVVSVAMASMLEEKGYFDAFDSVHGSSAGACGAAYFAAGDAARGGRIYFEDINNRQFIDWRRPVLGRPIMNKNFLIEHVMRVVKPLDATAIVQSPGFLNVIATEVATGNSRHFDTFANLDDILSSLKASICLPIIAGKSVKIDGSELVDGGLVQQIALESAASKGATHAIVLLTRTQDRAKRIEKAGLQADALALGWVYGSKLRSIYEGRNRQINELLTSALDGQFICDDGQIMSVETIARKANSTYISRLCIDGCELHAAFDEGRAAMADYLS